MIGSIGIDDIMIYIDDIIVCWPIFLSAIGSCIVLVFFYNILLRCCAEILAWISIITVGLGMTALGYFVRVYGKDNYPEGDTTQYYMSIASYVIWGLTLIYFCAVLCAWESIKISIKILKTSAKVVSRNLRVIFVPLVGIVIITVWVFFFAYSMLWLFSCGEITSKSTLGGTTSYKSFDWSDHEKIMIWYSLFCFFWVAAFIMAATSYV